MHTYKFGTHFISSFNNELHNVKSFPRLYIELLHAHESYMLISSKYLKNSNYNLIQNGSRAHTGRKLTNLFRKLDKYMYNKIKYQEQATSR